MWPLKIKWLCHPYWDCTTSDLPPCCMNQSAAVNSSHFERLSRLKQKNLLSALRHRSAIVGPLKKRKGSCVLGIMGSSDGFHSYELMQCSLRLQECVKLAECVSVNGVSIFFFCFHLIIIPIVFCFFHVLHSSALWYDGGLEPIRKSQVKKINKWLNHSG